MDGPVAGKTNTEKTVTEKRAENGAVELTETEKSRVLFLIADKYYHADMQTFREQVIAERDEPEIEEVKTED